MSERNIADQLAEKQRDISVSEFFLKNKHLLGFDNPKKALLTTIKEAVDNSLDACEEMRQLPDLLIQVDQVTENRFKVTIEDNGPGIVKEQIPKIFAKLLYGSKFHRLKCSRGQQGIGISASVMYGQLTTGKPAIITSKTSPKQKAHYYELHLNTSNNEPEIIKEAEVDWDNKDHGTKVTIELEGLYQKGQKGIEEYLKLTAISNPHAQITYISPEKEELVFPRGINKLPEEPKEIKPHPYGVQLGILIKMLKDTKSNTLQSFLTTDFCRISPALAKTICQKALLYEKSRPSRIAREEAENLYKAMQETKIMAPPTNCVTPIGEDAIIQGLKKEIKADFYAAVTRPPEVYSGNPFIVECGIAYGGELPSEELIKVLRFANRVPLLYQQSACVSNKAIIQTAWRNYGISQSKGAIPAAPMILFIHVASVWVPFTSESKEAIAHYPEILKELKLALQECGRKLASYVRKNVRAKEQRERISLFEHYIPELAFSLSKISDGKKEDLEKELNKILKKGMSELLAQVEHDEEPETKKEL
jgi:DNA topoisomerase-6 subunit B